MKKLIIILLFTFLIGCYDDNQESTGYYLVESDSVVDIYYTDGYGDTAYAQSSGGEWVVTVYLKQDESPDPFYYDVVVISKTGLQNIKIVTEFEGQQYLPQVTENNAEQVEQHSVFCPKWTTKCAKVKINF